MNLIREESFKNCQDEITKVDLEIKTLIQDILNCAGPFKVLDQYNGLIENKTKTMKVKLENLERIAYEQDKETNKIAINKILENYKKNLENIQISLRKANFACQSAIEKSDKQELLAGSTGIKKRKVESNKNSLTNDPSTVTQNLFNLTRLMSEQINQQESTLGSLVSSSSQIQQTQEELKNVSGHIHNSSKLLTKYGRREITDKLLILLTLIFFFGSVLYIIKKRLWSYEDSTSS